MRKIPKSEADIIQGPFKVKTRKQMDDELRDLMAEGGKVKNKHDANHAYNYDDNESLKGVHKVIPVHEPGKGVKHDRSMAGDQARYAKKANMPEVRDSLNEKSKAKHEGVLQEMRDMPAPNIKGLAEGGMVDEENEIEHHASIAAAIMAKRRKYAEGGQVDLESNEEEQPNQLNDLNEAALKENYDSDIQDLDQPEDSNEDSRKIESDRMDMISAIRRKLHKMR